MEQLSLLADLVICRSRDQNAPCPSGDRMGARLRAISLALQHDKQTQSPGAGSEEGEDAMEILG
jgi:hypothetical protein